MEFEVFKGFIEVRARTWEGRTDKLPHTYPYQALLQVIFKNLNTTRKRKEMYTH